MPALMRTPLIGIIRSSDIHGLSNRLDLIDSNAVPSLGARLRSSSRCRCTRGRRRNGDGVLGLVVLGRLGGIVRVASRGSRGGSFVGVLGCRHRSIGCGLCRCGSRLIVFLLLVLGRLGGVGGLSRSLGLGLVLLGGSCLGGRGVDDAAANGGHDLADVTRALCGSEDLALVGGAVEVAGAALVLDALALGLPELAAGVACGRSRVPACLALLVAVLGGGPAAGFAGVGGNFLSAPVGILNEAACGLQTFGLGGLRSGAGGSASNEFGNAGSGNLVLGVLVVVDVEADAWLAGGDVSGNAHGLRRTKVSIALQEDLGATSVELWVALVGVVKGQNLWTG